MKNLILGLGLSLCSLSALAAAKPCEELKEEIDAKIRANGVVSYSLEIVEKGADTGKQVVGSCGGGTKDIVYKRG